MSFTGVRTYFRSRCEALGYIEHKEAFSDENVARPQGKRVYFIRMGEATQASLDHSSIDMRCLVEVHLFAAAGNNTIANELAARTDGEALIASAMNTERRITQASFRNILLGSMTVEPIAESNDNAAVAKLSFTVMTTLGL